MSRYNDISQLLDEIGTSDRSAGDPWTISRSGRGTVKRSSFSPAVVADLGAPAQELTTEIQSSGQIAKADQIPTASSNNGSSKSSTSGILGGFLSLFPLASTVSKLFGLGGSSSPPPLMPYIAPPSVSFEGAMQGPAVGSVSNTKNGSLLGLGSTSQWGPSSGSGVQSLSYNAAGLPRHSSPDVMGQALPLTRSDFASEPSAAGPAQTAGVSSTGSSSAEVMGQLGNLTSSNFTSKPEGYSPLSSADLMATMNMQGPGPGSSGVSTGVSGSPASVSGGTSSSSQQGQSILVQVQAMDSQSFMDHSGDIAQAVRQAMLNLHSVNDVIADL
jgi:hypothetical protein